MFNKLFSKIEDEQAAKSMAKQGAYGVLLFIVMTLVGLAVAFFLKTSPVDGGSVSEDDALAQIIGTLILVPIQLIMAWRIYQGKGWLVSIFVLLWLSVEIGFKIVGGTASAGWIICYVAMAIMIVNGFRGCWYLREVNNNIESSPT